MKILQKLKLIKLIFKFHEQKNVSFKIKFGYIKNMLNKKISIKKEEHIRNKHISIIKFSG